MAGNLGDGQEPIARRPDGERRESWASTVPDGVGERAVRLLVGSVVLGLEALGGQPTSTHRDPSPSTASSAEVAAGLAVRGAHLASSLTARGADLMRRGLRTAGSPVNVLLRFAPDFLTEPLERAPERTKARAEQLGAVGRRELARARAEARKTFDRTLDSLIDRVAESPQVRQAIRTQSTTATEEAVDELQGRAALLDSRLEQAMRRLLGRKQASTPAP